MLRPREKPPDQTLTANGRSKDEHFNAPRVHRAEELHSSDTRAAAIALLQNPQQHLKAPSLDGHVHAATWANAWYVL